MKEKDCCLVCGKEYYKIQASQRYCCQKCTEIGAKRMRAVRARKREEIEEQRTGRIKNLSKMNSIAITNGLSYGKEVAKRECQVKIVRKW